MMGANVTFAAGRTIIVSEGSHLWFPVRNLVTDLY